MSIPRQIRAHYDRWIGLVDVSEEPFKTHVPVLIQLAQSLKPRRVAEFGMGYFSTSVFLDRTLFPSLEHLTSFEDDPEWFSVVTQKHAQDPRFEANLVSTPMWKISIKLRASDYDLVFIDDSKQSRDRLKTILALRLARGITKGPVVVVHDVEQPRYRIATMLFPNRKYFHELCPQTGVLCRKLGL